MYGPFPVCVLFYFFSQYSFSYTMLLLSFYYSDYMSFYNTTLSTLELKFFQTFILILKDEKSKYTYTYTYTYIYT